MIEVLIALGIFTVGTLVIINLFPKGLRLGRESKEISVATGLAQERIEEIISLNYDDIPAGVIDSKARINPNPQNPYYIYQREARSAYVDSNLNESITDTELKKITVTVYWIADAKEKTVQLIRLLNKK